MRWLCALGLCVDFFRPSASEQNPGHLTPQPPHTSSDPPPRRKGLCTGLCAEGALCVLIKKLCFGLCAPFVRSPAWRPAQKIRSHAVIQYYSDTVIQCSNTVTQYYGNVQRKYSNTVLRYCSNTVLQHYGIALIQYYSTVMQ